jgi:hypothetical protein
MHLLDRCNEYIEYGEDRRERSFKSGVLRTQTSNARIEAPRLLEPRQALHRHSPGPCLTLCWTSRLEPPRGLQ